jgi:hypothetical protein
MAKAFTPPAGGHQHGVDPLACLARVPLAEKKLRIQVVAGPALGKSWEAVADGEGRFSVDTQGAILPQAPCLVASVDGTRPLFSTTIAPAAGEVEFRVYPGTEDDRSIAWSEMNIFYSLRKDGPRPEMEVTVQLAFQNSGTELYVGSRPVGSQGPGREIFRFPVPADAVVDTSRSSTGLGWTPFPRQGGWIWYVIDSPVPPRLEEPQGLSTWELRFRTRPIQESTNLYPMGLNMGQFAAWCASEEIVVESEQLPGKAREKQPDPLEPGSGPKEWNVTFGRNLARGSNLALVARIDNAALGEINQGSLLLMGTFVLAGAAAIALGLLFGRREPSLETLLGEATGDEIVARIAALDERKERGEILPDEYGRLREKLMRLARSAVVELSPQAAGAPAGASAPGSALPPSLMPLVERLRELETGGAQDPRRIQERLLILDEIARGLLAATSDPLGGPGAGRR